MVDALAADPSARAERSCGAAGLGTASECGTSDRTRAWATDPANVPVSGNRVPTQPTFVKYRWVSVCAGAGPGDILGKRWTAAKPTCPDPAERVWRLWGQTPAGDWKPITTQCAGPAGPPPAATPKPQVTPGLVLTALRRIGLPALEARTQPRDKTLVNFATIFYAEPQTFTRTLTLLGQSVQVHATPTSFRGTTGTGRPPPRRRRGRRTRPRTSPTTTPTRTSRCPDQRRRHLLGALPRRQRRLAGHPGDRHDRRAGGAAADQRGHGRAVGRLPSSSRLRSRPRRRPEGPGSFQSSRTTPPGGRERRGGAAAA